MGQIGEPTRRYTVIPLDEPVSPTNEPVTPAAPDHATRKDSSAAANAVA